MKYENINLEKNMPSDKKCKQKVENVAKNSKNYVIFKQISKDFAQWINGIQEDEPLKTEAKNIYFLLEYKQNDIVLSYSADEKFLHVLDYGAYFPLEAEYLYSSTLKDISKQIFEAKTTSKNQVFDMLKQVILANIHKFDFFKKHNVFYGLRLSKNQASNCLAKL